MSGGPDPAAVVADADVLAADLLVGGAARTALDHLRAHSWTTLHAGEPLLADAEALIAELADPALAADWRRRVAEWATVVEHPAGDHPALGPARAGGAAHVLTLDAELAGAATNAALKRWVDVSVRTPTAFARLFDAAALYEVVVGGDYPGPDRDPRG